MSNAATSREFRRILASTIEEPGCEAAREAPRHASRDEAVSALLAAIDVRDAATSDHSRAVGVWSGRIAKTLGMSAEEQRIALLAGTLHDVGKISTPPEILLKEGPLNDDEWEVMRAHARIGAEMLERIPLLADLAPIVRAHHERPDGTGYPDRLHDDDIPVVARIIAVADSFHAMISRRPYRRSVPVARALEILRSGAGTQWDPYVVQTMIGIVHPAAADGPATLRAVTTAA